MSHEGIRFVPKTGNPARWRKTVTVPHRVTPEKVRVLLTEGKGLEIDWVDGHKSAWSFAWLREACPCATCVERARPAGPQAWPAQTRPAAVLPCIPRAQARERPRRRPLCHSVQLARRPLRRHLFLGVPAPRLPVPRVRIRRRRTQRNTQLTRGNRVEASRNPLRSRANVRCGQRLSGPQL